MSAAKAIEPGHKLAFKEAMKAGLLRGLWMGLALNLLVLEVLALARGLEPQSELRLSMAHDAVLIFGRNQLGLLSIRSFRNWTSAEDYLVGRRLQLPIITHAERGLDPSPKLRHDQATGRFRIAFSSAGADSQSSVLMAPDAASALIFVDYIRYSRLEPSLLGFSVPLTLASP